MDSSVRRSSRWRRLRADPGKIAMFLGLTVVSLVMLYPFGFMILNSLRTESQYLSGHGFSVSSWQILFSSLPVGAELLNSMLICVGAIAIIVGCASAAGFAFAKLQFRRQGVLFLGIIGCMMIPVQSIIIPEYVNLANFHLINNYLAPILVYAALGMPFATFLMTVFFRGLPDELVEAALCDGMGYFGVFRRIGVRMAAPAFAAIAVLQFIQIWDDLLVALLLLQEPGNRTITVGLGVLSSGHEVSIPALMAGSLVSALPAIMVYLFFQRYLVSGLTMGVNR
ncbi:MAG: carbohydrate ABC transporter permease [Candidatus Dormibacteria bacterium]